MSPTNSWISVIGEERDDKIGKLKTHGFEIFKRKHKQNRKQYREQVSASQASTLGEFAANDMDNHEENEPSPPIQIDDYRSMRKIRRLNKKEQQMMVRIMRLLEMQWILMMKE